MSEADKQYFIDMIAAVRAKLNALPFSRPIGGIVAAKAEKQEWGWVGATLGATAMRPSCN